MLLLHAVHKYMMRTKVARVPYALYHVPLNGDGGTVFDIETLAMSSPVHSDPGTGFSLVGGSYHLKPLSSITADAKSLRTGLLASALAVIDLYPAICRDVFCPSVCLCGGKGGAPTSADFSLQFRMHRLFPEGKRETISPHWHIFITLP